MAYMDQEKKRAIKAELDKFMPKSWKYSLGVHNHSSIIFTLRSAPINVLEHLCDNMKKYVRDSHVTLNQYHIERQFTEGKVLDTFEKIKVALNLNNHDKSDIYTDYHDVGHYVDMQIGSWNKPFEVK